MIVITVYYVTYVVVTCMMQDQMKVLDLMIYLNICNDVIILAACILYTYTICLLRSAIAHTSSFQFDTKGTYVITGLFFFSMSV